MLEIRNLTCGYGAKTVLHDISLDIKEREFVGIIGPNGSGKTTLLRAITRILKPQSGVILFGGKDIWRLSFRELARKIAVVPQDFTAGDMSAEEFVLLGRIPYFGKIQFLESKRDFEIAEKCMTLTDTLKLKQHRMAEISGGERQLALVARALCQEPKLLLLDEPISHLDITHQVGILDLIKKLNREYKLTVIMVLHDLNMASEYCNRLILLNNGRIQKSGLPEEVMQYKILEEVYKTVVVVKKNPISSKPHVFVVSEEEKQKREKN